MSETIDPHENRDKSGSLLMLRREAEPEVCERFARVTRRDDGAAGVWTGAELRGRTGE